MVRHTKATLAFYDKQVLADGAIVEMVIWRLAQSLPGSSHRLKYRLFYGFPGKRLVGYDNESGKGDHRHRQVEEEDYDFSTAEKLVADFLTDVRLLRGEA